VGSVPRGQREIEDERIGVELRLVDHVRRAVHVEEPESITPRSRRGRSRTTEVME
jgi:hypothetical protein